MTIIYELKSPIIIEHVNSTETVDKYELSYADEDIFIALYESVQNDMTNMGKRGLAAYINLNEKLYKIIKSIIVDVDRNYAVTKVEATKELSEQEIEMLKNYIEGQFADGWGEGFEQQKIISYKDKFEEIIEEEDENGDIDERVEIYEDTVYVYAHFWNNENFNFVEVKRIS